MEELFGYDSMNDEQSPWKTKNTQSKKIENLTKQNRSKQWPNDSCGKIFLAETSLFDGILKNPFSSKVSQLLSLGKQKFCSSRCVRESISIISEMIAYDDQ